MNHSDVAFYHPPFLKGKGKGPVGFAVLCENNKTRGIPVYTMNSVNPLDLKKLRRQLIQMFPGKIPAIRADGYAGALVQCHDVFIIMDQGKKRLSFHINRYNP